MPLLSWKALQTRMQAAEAVDAAVDEAVMAAEAATEAQAKADTEVQAKVAIVAEAAIAVADLLAKAATTIGAEAMPKIGQLRMRQSRLEKMLEQRTALLRSAAVVLPSEATAPEADPTEALEAHLVAMASSEDAVAAATLLEAKARLQSWQQPK